MVNDHLLTSSRPRQKLSVAAFSFQNTVFKKIKKIRFGLKLFIHQPRYCVQLLANSTLNFKPEWKIVR